MADKNSNLIASAKTSKFKRSTTLMSARKPSASASKTNYRAKSNLNNTTIINENDVTIRQDSTFPDFDPIHRQIAYGKFVRAMLEECLVDEKVQREETEIDIQMSQLSDRFIKTMNQLDNTSKRLKDISFVVEQKRLLDLKSQDCSKFYETTDNSNIQEIVDDLSATEKSCLDKLKTNNVDFGYTKDSGHKQLIDAVTEAINGLDHIKKHSGLDLEKFKEYAKTQPQLKDLEKDRLDLENLKTEFDIKFPKFSEKLLKEASEMIAIMMKSDDEGDNTGDESSADD